MCKYEKTIQLVKLKLFRSNKSRHGFCFRMTRSDPCPCLATVTLFDRSPTCALQQPISPEQGGEGEKGGENTKGETKDRRMGRFLTRQILTSCTRSGDGGPSVPAGASRSDNGTARFLIFVELLSSRWSEVVIVIVVAGWTFILSGRRRCGGKQRTSLNATGPSTRNGHDGHPVPTIA